MSTAGIVNKNSEIERSSYNSINIEIIVALMIRANTTGNIKYTELNRSVCIKTNCPKTQGCTIKRDLFYKFKNRK